MGQCRLPGDGHGSWGSDGSRGVNFACHRVRAAAVHNTPEWAGLRPTVLTRTGRGHSPLQLAHPPRCRALDPGRCCTGGGGAAGSTTPASCWEFPVYKTQTVILAQLRRSRAAIDVKGFVHCKVLGWRKNPCHSRGCVGRLVCGGGGAWLAWENKLIPLFAFSSGVRGPLLSLSPLCSPPPPANAL